jgi:hypothetical protein
MHHHDNMRHALGRELQRFPQVQATIEPRVENPQGAADLRRGDIKVHKDGTTWVLDVGVMCPGHVASARGGTQTPWRTPRRGGGGGVRGDQERQIR